MQEDVTTAEKAESRPAEAEEVKEEKPQPKGPSFERLRELEALYQKREAAAHKEASQAHRDVDGLRSRVAELEAELEEAKLYGGDEDAKAAHKKLREVEGTLRQRTEALEEREAKLRASEKAAAVWVLNARYNVPEGELEKCNTADEMYMRALEWEVKRLQEEAPKASTKKVPPPESGEQRLPRKSFVAMSSEEFNKEWDRLKKQAQRRPRA